MWDPARQQYNDAVELELRKMGATDKQIQQFHKSTANVMSDLLMDWFNAGGRRARRYAEKGDQ